MKKAWNEFELIISFFFVVQHIVYLPESLESGYSSQTRRDVGFECEKSLSKSQGTRCG